MRRDASGGVKQLRGGPPFPSLRTRSRTFLRSPSLCRCSPVTLYAASSASPAATNRTSCCSQRPRRQSATSYMSIVPDPYRCTAARQGRRVPEEEAASAYRIQPEVLGRVPLTMLSVSETSCPCGCTWLALFSIEPPRTLIAIGAKLSFATITMQG